MLPYINIFGKEFATYTLCALAGILCAGLFACRSIRRFAPDDQDHMLKMLLLAAIGVMVGGHLLYAITNWKILVFVVQHLSLIQSLDDVWLAATVIFGGSVFYGGFLGGALVGALYIRRQKLDFSIYTDVATPAIPLFHTFGRIGCFLGGCCYGVESPIGFTYEHSLMEEANGVCRFPIQLVESGFNLLLFAVLTTLLYKGKLKGHLLQLYILVYAVGRFIFEFFRGDVIRGLWLGFSTSQWIAAALVVITTVWLVVGGCRKQKPKQEESISS